MHLPPQYMEIIRGSRAIGDLHIVVGAKLQESLQPRGRMLRSLTLIAMGQQQNQPGHAQPLHFARRNELIDDHLRAIGEIAELRFPENQRSRFSQAVSVFKSDHCLFGKKRIDDFKFALTLANMIQRDVSLFAFLIDQRGMALGKCTA